MNLDTNSEIVSLQKQVFGLMIALILVSGTLAYYFYGQARLAHRSIVQDKNLIDVMKKNEQIANTFVGQLVAYGQAHPEFRPVVAKYGFVPAPNPPAAAPKK